MMTPRNILLCIAISTLPVMVKAHGGEVDFNGDGQFSLSEIRAAMPEISSAQFARIDLNGNGLLNENEVALGVQSGLLSSFFH